MTWLHDVIKSILYVTPKLVRRSVIEFFHINNNRWRSRFSIRCTDNTIMFIFYHPIIPLLVVTMSRRQPAYIFPLLPVQDARSVSTTG